MVHYLGRVVEFIDGSRVKAGLVTRESQDRLQLTDQAGRQRNLSVKDVVILHEAVVDPSAFKSWLATFEPEVEGLVGEVDTELMWETLLDEGDELPLEKTALVYFGEVSALLQSACLRAILDDPLRFKVHRKTVTLRSAVEIQAALRATRSREEREARRHDLLEWVRSTLESRGISESPLDYDQSVAEVKDFLFRRRPGVIESILAEAFPDVDPRETAFRLLSACGRLPEGTDRFLAIAGIPDRFPEAVLQACSQITLSDRIRGTPFDSGIGSVFSIDDAETREVDDALSLESRNGNLRLCIYIADVASFVHKGDILDNEAQLRSTSVYLPHRKIRMLPDSLSCDRASLVVGEARAAVAFRIDLDSDARVARWEVSRGPVTVTHRLSYEEADQLTSAGEPGSPGDEVRELCRLARVLESNRLASGAFSPPRKELKISVHNDEVSVEVIDPDSPSRRMVSEMMILANSLAAELVSQANLAGIFRAQNAPRSKLQVPETYDPVILDAIFREIEPSRLTTHPEEHAGLGLKAYVQVTSPLRRFTDLVMQRQLAAHVAGEPIPYSEQELLKIMAHVQSVEGAARTAERMANRFYLLRYLRDWYSDRPLEVVVLRSLINGYLVESRDFFVRGHLNAARSLQPRDVVAVRVDRADPERDSLIFRCEE